MKEFDFMKDAIISLKERGCSVVRYDVRQGNHIADLVGYVSKEDGSLNPIIVAEIKKTINPKVQQQLFSISKTFDTDYALLTFIEEKSSQNIWFNSKTGLPVQEPPEFDSYYNYLEKTADIEKQVNELLNILRKVLSSEQSTFAIIQILLLRAYMSNKQNLHKWLNLSVETLNKFLEQAKSQYDIKSMDTVLLNLSKDDFMRLLFLTDSLPPFNKKYLDVFIALFEKKPGTIIENATTRNLKDIFVKIVQSLPLKKKNIIDLTAGMGFNLMSLSRNNEFSKVVGIEINMQVANIAKILSIISKQENIELITDDALLHTTDEYFELVAMEPPINPRINIKEKYERFQLVSNTSRKTVNALGLFIEKALEITENKGYIVTVVPEGFLFSNGRFEKETRKFILEKTLVKAIISLPAYILQPYTGIKLSILILQKNKEKVIPKEFFVGKIESIEDSKEVVDEFAAWLREDDSIG